MKIIEPSATIIEDELSQLSIYQRIDRCASVCYQRPPKPTEEEAQEFCRKMVKTGHYSTLEMATIHLAVDMQQAEFVDTEKFLLSHDEGLQDKKYTASGSIRAWIESAAGNYISNLLSSKLPIFFSENSEVKQWDGVRFALPHEIPWQHKHVAVRFIVNRAVSHELVRHRPCSFLQESQRYCRYEDDVVFIEPEWFGRSKQSTVYSAEYDWEALMEACECGYKEFLSRGFKPQHARAVLPNSTKTELICYASLPQWKHIFNLRCSPAADPEMRRVMIPLREDFQEKYPEAFE